MGRATDRWTCWTCWTTSRHGSAYCPWGKIRDSRPVTIGAPNSRGRLDRRLERGYAGGAGLAGKSDGGGRSESGCGDVRFDPDTNVGARSFGRRRRRLSRQRHYVARRLQSTRPRASWNRGGFRALCRGGALPARCLRRPSAVSMERFFCYCEDLDLAFRLRLQGHRCLQVADAVVRHHGSGITGSLGSFRVGFMAAAIGYGPSSRTCRGRVSICCCPSISWRLWRCCSARRFAAVLVRLGAACGRR